VPIRELALLLLVGASLLTAGCSGNSSSVPCSSALLIELDVTTDVEGLDLVITEVLWAITGNGMASMVGVIDTSDPNATPSVEIFGLEPGDYRIELEATSEDGESTCRGSAMFDVTAGVAIEVAVLLRCSTVQRFGAVRVNGARPGISRTARQTFPARSNVRGASGARGAFPGYTGTRWTARRGGLA
jgi:hypothetical protein